MIHKIVSVYDVKAEAFAQPVFVQSHGAAVRSFGEAINAPAKDNNFAKFPEDFCLFALGEFDDEKADFTLLKAPLELAKAISLVESTSQSTSRTLLSPPPLEEAISAA